MCLGVSLKGLMRTPDKKIKKYFGPERQAAHLHWCIYNCPRSQDKPKLDKAAYRTLREALDVCCSCSPYLFDLFINFSRKNNILYRSKADNFEEPIALLSFVIQIIN